MKALRSVCAHRGLSVLRGRKTFSRRHSNNGGRDGNAVVSQRAAPQHITSASSRHGRGLPLAHASTEWGRSTRSGRFLPSSLLCCLGHS